MASRGPEQGRNRWVRRGAALGATVAALVTTSVAIAAFTSTVTGGGMALSTKRIFPGVRSAWPWDVRDASGGGAETNNSDALSFADTVTSTTKNWSSSFSATRFDDFDFSSGKPPGIPISSATFSFTFAPSRASDNACFYIEVRRASTNALLGTHGSSGSPLSCANLGAQVAATVDVSAEVTTTDIANDLRIRAYANQSGNKAIKIDIASVSITTPYSNATMFETRWDDEANAASTAVLWPFVATDGTAYASAASFATTFNAARYIKLTPNESVSTSATISSAQVQFAYESSTAGDTAREFGHARLLQRDRELRHGHGLDPGAEHAGGREQRRPEDLHEELRRAEGEHRPGPARRQLLPRLDRCICPTSGLRSPTGRSASSFWCLPRPPPRRTTAGASGPDGRSSSPCRSGSPTFEISRPGTGSNGSWSCACGARGDSWPSTCARA